MAKITISIILVSALMLGFISNQRNHYQKKSNDDYNYIAINECLMWVSNNGDGSYNPNTGNSGFFWPGGENATVSSIYEDGLLYGGKIGREIRINGNTHRQGLQAGKILSDGTADDPNLTKYRVYKIRKGWELLPPGEERDNFEKDYNEWPVEDGAPWIDVDNDGIYTLGIDTPEHLGDETLWYISNDLDTLRSTFTFGSNPLGIEFQTTVFAFNSDYSDALKNSVFKRYILINKGEDTIRDMRVAYWSDDDVGFAGDDYSGVDPNLNMGYTYNSDNNDEGYYEEAPPAVGHMLLKGPIDNNNSIQPVTGFTFYINGSSLYHDPENGIPEGSIQMYNNLEGRSWKWDPYLDPNTDEETRLPLSGDPVSETGWYEGNGWPNGPEPGDRRALISSGPFLFMPGDTQTVDFAIMMAQGTDNLNSITELRNTAAEIKQFYYNGFITNVNNSQESVIPEFSIQQNFPNPFNPATTIRYSLHQSGLVTLRVYDVLGRIVGTLVEEFKSAGKYDISFDASNLSSGTYIYQLKLNDIVETKKMLLLK